MRLKIQIIHKSESVFGTKIIHTVQEKGRNIGKDTGQWDRPTKPSLDHRDWIKTDGKEEPRVAPQIGRMALVNKYIVEWSTHSVLKLFGYLSTLKEILDVTFSLNSGNEAYSLVNITTKLSPLDLHKLIDKSKIYVSHFKIRQNSKLAAV